MKEIQELKDKHARAIALLDYIQDLRNTKPNPYPAAKLFMTEPERLAMIRKTEMEIELATLNYMKIVEQIGDVKI